MSDIYVAEIRAWDPATASLKILRFATTGFVTSATDTPPHKHYDGRLLQPAVMQRSVFASGTTSGRSQASYGDLILLNGDGLLDSLLGYGVDGRIVTLRRGPPGAAYPSGFVTIADDLTASQFQADADKLTLKIRDRQYELDVEFQPTKYAGTNVLPDGLEGVATDLQGQPKPRAFGVVKNVPAVCVNTSKLIYQVNDGPVASLDAVYDRGIGLGSGFYVRPVTDPFGADAIWSMCYGPGPGLWVAGGANNKLYTSPDGEIWTARTSPFAAGFLLNGIAYSPSLGLFVAVGETTPGGGDGSKQRIARSADGITWTLDAAAVDTPIAVAWSATLALFVVVGYANYTATSADGISWTVRTNVFGGSDAIAGIVWGDGLWVAVGSFGKISTSRDGTTWTLRTTTLGSITFLGVAYGLGLYIAIGSFGSATLATSVDGITWTARNSPFPASHDMKDVAFNGSVFMLVGIGYRAISDDGISWVVQASTDYNAVGFGNGIFVMGGVGLARTYQTAYADLADLQDDTLAPNPGGFLAYPAGGYFRLGSSPDGLVTADVTEGATAADRTAAQLFARLLADPLGEIVIAVSRDDVAALDLAIPAPLGLFVNAETTVADVLDQIASSAGAWWGLDRSGLMRIQQFTAPSGTPVYAFTKNDTQQLQRVPLADDTDGLPTWLSILTYAHNYSIQTTDLAAGVTDDRRAFVALSDRTVSAEDDSVLLAHPLAVQLVEPSLLVLASDAQAEVTRRQTLRGVMRDRFQAVFPLTAETEVLDMGNVVTLAHPRFGLSGGPSFRLLGLAPDAQKRTLTLQLWR